MLKTDRGRNPHSAQMREMLGLKYGARLPKEGMPPRIIQDYTVWVNPLKSSGGRRKMHRVMAKCNKCGFVLSAGRTHQHLCQAKSRVWVKTK